jgi:hypothetical protein
VRKCTAHAKLWLSVMGATVGAASCCLLRSMTNHPMSLWHPCGLLGFAGPISAAVLQPVYCAAN